MIKAIIFDMDGVISDTQTLHSQAESKMLERFGINIPPEEISKRYAGVKTKDFINDLLSGQGKEYDIEALISEKEALMIKAIDSIKEVTGAAYLIRQMYESGFKLAVASASNAVYVNPVLKALGVSDYFQAVISGDMAKNGKPDPEIFLLAAAKLGVAPKECLVIEDGINGMEAAKAAGMYCIGLVTGEKHGYPTINLVNSLSEITLGYIRTIVK